MKRKQIDYLMEWKSSELKYPLFITGAKGVGKTYLILEFIKDFFRNRIYINYEQNPGAFYFCKQTEVKAMKEFLENYYRVDLSHEGVIILDEVPFDSPIVEKVLQLYKILPQLSFIFISSNCSKIPDISLKYQRLLIHPMDFREFLEALGYDWYTDIIEEHFDNNKPIPSILHRELLNLFDKYLVIGGLPAAVNEYLLLETVANIPERHQLIDCYYMAYAEENLENGDYLKAKAVYHSIPKQLSKQNKKFQYSLLRKGATYHLYKDQIDFLVDHNLLLKAEPLSSEKADSNVFKLYQSDIGMILSKATKNLANSGAKEKKEFSCGLLENYIAGCLYKNDFPLFFWESKSKAKIDFILLKGEEYIPIEVWADANTRSRNVFEFSKEYPVPYQIKISINNFSYKSKVKYIPLYATYCLNKYNI